MTDREKTTIATDGGSYIDGDVTTDIFVGRDYIVGYSAAEVSALIEQLRSTAQPLRYDGRQPYMGLTAFTEADAEFFFGREALVDELLTRVARARFVCIAGPPGSGKSSLAQAGLIAALKQGCLPGSQQWCYAILRPGHSPIEQLALAMARLAQTPDAANYLRQQGRQDAGALHAQAETLLTHLPEQRLVLYVDQFEELFTQTSDVAERTAFLALLTTAIAQPQGRVTAILSLRTDFLAHCADFAELRALISQEFQLVGAMTSAELLRAIILPALYVGVELEAALAAQIVADMAGEPGALPLLQFALRDLFDSYEPQRGAILKLTLDDYLQLGGLRQALERHADRVFATFSEAQKELARQILTRLITIGQGTIDTRRSALFQELTSTHVTLAEITPVVNTLADARLVTTNGPDAAVNNDGDERTITLAHERLIDAWPWLHRLVNENRERIALQNQISDDAREWAQAGCDRSYLYSGTRLATVQEALQYAQFTLDAQAEAYVQAALTAQAAAQQRRRRTLQIVMAALALAVLIFAGLAGRATRERGRATESAQRADQKLAEVRASELASRSQLLIAQDHHAGDVALLLARDAVLNSLALTVTVPPLIDRALRSAVENAGWRLTLPSAQTHHHGAVTSVHFSPDGRTLVSAGEDGTVRIWRASDLEFLKLLIGHTASVTAVVYSPDGQWIVSGSADRTVRIWGSATWKPVRALGGHTGSVTAVAYSPDGKWIVSGSEDKTVRLWDALTGALVRTLEGHKEAVNVVAYSPDGKWLISGSGDNTVQVWDATTWKPMYTLEGHTGGVTAVAYSPDNKWIASGGFDDTLRVWNAATGALVRTWKGHPNSVYALAYSPDSKRLVSAGMDAKLRLWDAATGELVHTLEGHVSGIDAVIYSPDGKWIVSGDWDTTLRLWDAATGTPVHTPRDHKEGIDVVAYSPDGKWPVSSSVDKTKQMWIAAIDASIRTLVGHTKGVDAVAYSPNAKWIASWSRDKKMVQVRDAVTGVPVCTLEGHTDSVSVVTYSPDGRWIVSWGGDETVRVWEAATGVSSPLYIDDVDAVAAVAYSPDGKQIASGGGTWEGTLRVWDAATGAPVHTLEGHTESISSIAYSPNGKWIASGSDDSTVRVWDAITGIPVHKLDTYRSNAYAVTYSPDSKWLVTGSEDHTVRVWDAKTGVAIRTLEGHTDGLVAVAYSPDGKWLIAGTGDDTVWVWNALTGAFMGRLVGHTAYVGAVAYSPDGKQIASGSVDQTVRVWDAVTGALLHTLKGHASSVIAVAYSPDGKWIASGSDDKTVRVWNALTGSLVRTLEGHTGTVNDIKYSPDGKWIVSGSVDQTVRVWEATIDQLLQLAEARIQRPAHLLMDDERRQLGLVP